MRKITLNDNGQRFDVSFFEAKDPSRIVLFSVGGGSSR